MRIAYLSHDVLPSPSTASEQLMNNLTAMGRVPGVSIDLLAPSRPDANGQPAERRAEIARFYGLPTDLFDDGLDLVENHLPSWMQGYLRMGVHSVTAATAVSRKRHDIVYVRELFPLVTALMTGLPVFFETYRADINTSSALALCRRLCYTKRNLAGVITHSELARQSFIDVGMDPGMVICAHNGFSRDVMEPELTREAARSALGLDITGPLMVYTGHVGPGKGTSLLVRIARRMPEVTMLVVGAVPGSKNEQWMDAMIADADVRNIVTIPRVAPSQVPFYLYAADILVIPPASDPLMKAGRTVLPIKTFLYLAAGRPIIAGDLPDVKEVLEHDRNSVLVPPDDPDAATDEIRRLLADADRCARLAGTAREDSLRYTWEARADRVTGFLRERLETRHVR